MKRLALILGAAAMAAISVPTSARAQTGCNWWDLTCNGLASVVSDYAWHIAGRDQPGNVVYLRRRVDSNGNVIIEQARRNYFGSYLVVNNYTIRKGTVYGPNGELCKYSENNKGYKEECKYAKVNKISRASPVYTTKYKPAKVKPVTYAAPKVHTVKYKASKATVYGREKVKEGKGKGPKH